MNKPARITSAISVELDAATIALISGLAAARAMTPEQYTVEAIRRATESDADFQAFIQVGVDALDRGDVVSHDEMMAELDQMIEKHRARCG